MFVAMTQAQQEDPSNDILQYGVVTEREKRSSVLQLRPTQTLRQFRQTILPFSVKPPVSKNLRRVHSNKLQVTQNEIERELNEKQCMKK